MGLRKNGVKKRIVEKVMGLESDGVPDDEYLYGTFNESVRNNHKLANKAAHKALNLPMDDEMQITNTDNSVVNHYGGEKTGGVLPGLVKAGVVAAGMATGLGGAGWLVAEAISNIQTPVPASGTDTNTKYNMGLE